MIHINSHYQKLTAGYLFPEIERRVSAFARANPDAEIIKLGIGDVTEPLPEAIVAAMHRAVDEMGQRKSFRGYGPDQGYSFLREKMAQFDYHARNCDISPDEIFVSDGSKCDTGNFLDILSVEANVVAVADPVYPVYVDTNVMAGNTGEADSAGKYQGLVYLPATAENNFAPDLPSEPVDIIYMCYPNNPTGAVATRDTLAQWIEYARNHGSLILFDAAYEAYITDPSIPHSIYEIPGAREVAVEFRSFSKSAGFTGTRCAYTVVPRDVTGQNEDSSTVPLHALWARRQATKSNGVSYIVQRGAEAAYSSEGREQISKAVQFYLDNAQIIRQTLSGMGLSVYGGINAPYVWVRTPDDLDSWTFFDKLLEACHVVGTPGSGFGAAGEGYFRISAFNSRTAVEDAMRRIQQRLKISSSSQS